MIHSMTGFARTEAQLGTGQLRWEMRSVNHRYLDLQIRLPEPLRHLEQECRQTVAGFVRRGKVEASLSLEFNRSGPPGYRLNEALARQVIDYLDAVGQHISRPAPLDPLGVLRWPGVIEEIEPDLESVGPQVLEALSTAAMELRDARAREGQSIRGLLEGRCDDILEIVAAVQRRLPKVLAAIRSRITDKLETLTTDVNQDRLEQELVLLAQKLDVSEELERLQAHVAEVRSALDQDEPVGRRLDFLMQELNREANTLGSKSADAETTRCAVDLKVVIEQMREQVQNVE